jgi:glycosyltransferase involved in cell wall biosynthesis
MVCNFPTILEKYKTQGLRTADFSPAHDQVMNSYADNNNRPIDVLFVGGYSRHHQNRAKLLEAVAKMSKDINVVFHLDCSLFTRLAESKFGSLIPIRNYRRPTLIQAIAAEPVFGLDLYDALSKAKIVINGAIDMAGPDRGNMRCFEAMGCGSLLLSDDGAYPPGMIPDINLKIWHSPSDAVSGINELLADDANRLALSSAGHHMISEIYSKQRQWQKFQQLIS